MSWRTKASLAIAIAASLVGCNDSRTQAVQGQRPGSLIVPSSECLCDTVDDKVYFDFNSSLIRADARETLTKQAEWIIKYPKVSIVIAGNCDDRGSEEYNLALGYRRANAARDFLVAKGVPGSRISVVSYGRDRPLAAGDNERAWAKNRNAITFVR